MDNQPTQPSSRPFKQGEVLHTEGEIANALCILLKGKVSVHVSANPNLPPTEAAPSTPPFRLFDLESNIFLGASELVTGGLCFWTCRATEDGVLYSYPVETPAQLYTLAGTQKDYFAFIIQSQGLLLEKTRDALSALRERTTRLRLRADSLAIFFWILKESQGFSHQPGGGFFQNALERLEELRETGFQPPFRFDPAVLENALTPGESRSPTPSMAPDRLAYAIRLNVIPLETRKLFFGSDPQVAAHHIREAADCLADLLTTCRGTFAEAEERIQQLYADSGDSLFSAYLAASREIAQAGKDPTTAVEALNELIKLILETAETWKDHYSHPLRVDLEYIRLAKEQLDAQLRGSPGTPIGEGETSSPTPPTQALPEDLRNSAEKLLTYGGANKELSDTFMSRLNAFRNLKDRYEGTPEAKTIRAGLVEPFRRLYEGVLRRALTESDPSRLVTMFLRYGYADECLLGPEQTLALFRLAGRKDTPGAAPKAPDTPSAASGLVSIQTLPEWLARIRDRKAEPSRNEFDADYADAFQELKKEGKVTDRDKPAYEANVEAKLSFELDVQLGTCQRAVFGKPSLFCPTLHRAMITGEPDKAVITPEKVRETLDRIQTLDYSAFWREVRFIDPRKVIEKERVMKRVMPDIILLPTFGSRGMMWQEIGGRDRSLPGRFLLPAFTDETLENLLLRLIGNYRWELCITLSGGSAGDSTSSLVSEYNVYITTYKKSTSLTESDKDGIRQQVDKYKGILREIFTADYMVWIRNESQGNLRLNKEVRRIMSRHCPLGKAYREKLANHPAFAELLRLFQAQQTKEARSLESRYAKFRTAAQGHLSPEMEENLRFFRDL